MKDQFPQGENPQIEAQRHISFFFYFFLKKHLYCIELFSEHSKFQNTQKGVL